MTPITSRNLLKHELMGLKVNVLKDVNIQNETILGTVVDESRNTMTIRQEGNLKMVPKRNALFRFTLFSNKVDVSGVNLVGRPEDRVKKNHKRRW